jgi:predicted phosphodiesterase
MKLKVASDLHLEFYRCIEQMPTLDYDGEDYLILAGDIQKGTTCDECFEWFLNHLESRSIIYTMGNHEFYRQDYNSMMNEQCWMWQDRINATATQRGIEHRLILLNNTYYQSNDVEFIGATVWTDAGAGDTHLIARAPLVMNDFRLIQGFDCAKMIEEHEKSKKFVEHRLNESSLRKIVIMHHLPSFRSVNPKWHHSDINGFFYSNLEHWFESAELIIHGHTHNCADYTVGGCRVICNPLGYPTEMTEFLSNCTIEI